MPQGCRKRRRGRALTAETQKRRVERDALHHIVTRHAVQDAAPVETWDFLPAFTFHPTLFLSKFNLCVGPKKVLVSLDFKYCDYLLILLYLLWILHWIFVFFCLFTVSVNLYPSDLNTCLSAVLTFNLQTVFGVCINKIHGVPSIRRLYCLEGCWRVAPVSSA